MSLVIPLRETPETRPGFPCRTFRWTFQVRRREIGFIHQHQEVDGEWDDNHSAVWTACWNDQRPLRVGSDHVYWDGPHCLYVIGPVTIQLHRPNCEKCHGET